MGSMEYWDHVVRMHEMMSKDFRNGEDGLRAVLFLRSFFEQIGCQALSFDHPLHNRLSMGMEANYLWLTQYARKLITASSIPKFDKIVNRFCNPHEYLAANYEMETALKLYLEDLDVSFSDLDSLPTPDLIVNTRNGKTTVEVASLNPPEEEMLGMALFDHLFTRSFQNDVVYGGFANRVPSRDTLKKIMSLIDETIERVKASHEIEKLNLEGVATIYFAPEDIEDQLPEDCRRTFSFNTPHRRPIEEQIAKKIEEKKRQIQASEQKGILSIYTQIIDRKTISQLLENVDMEITITSYPKLLGLILTVPHHGIGVVSNMKTEDLRKIHGRDKVFLESEVGIYQYESSIIWLNLHADRKFPEEILYAFENYSSNLTRLQPL